jgi:hypothetical protein
MPPNSYVAACVADEWHVYGRAVKGGSARLTQIVEVMSKANFVLQLSGTIFPLGPKKDAEKVMINLGGDFRSNHPSVKWNDSDKATLCTIFNRVYGRYVGWSVLRLRRFMGRFFIRRSLTSKYKGRLIIPQNVSRPTALPANMPNSKCPVEEIAVRSWH